LGKKGDSSTDKGQSVKEDPSAPAAESKSKLVVIKKAAAASNQKSNLAGGYTPTIIARNQFVPHAGLSNEGQPVWPSGANVDEGIQ